MPRASVVRILVVCCLAGSLGGCWWRCGSFAGTWPHEELDLKPIRLLAIPEDVDSISAWFAWMKATHAAGLGPEGKPSRDGIVDALSDSYETRPMLRAPVTSLWATATLYRSLGEAFSGFDRRCRDYGFKDRDAMIEVSDGRRGDYCVSHVARQRSDPEGGCLWMDDYWSLVVIRRGRVVLYVVVSAGTREDAGAATREYLGILVDHIAQSVVQ